MPSLILEAMTNQSLFKLARYFLNYKTTSRTTLSTYTWRIIRYARWMEKSPDQIIAEVKQSDTALAQQSLAQHAGLVEDFVTELKGRNLAPATIADYFKSIKTFYKVNGVQLNLPYSLPRGVRYHDRAPRPEELQKLIDTAPLREKAMIAMLALGGFREGTLVKLQYRHVKEDLENNKTPIHIHVESDITKGKYGEYDTFIGGEAIEFLRAYLETRRRGTEKIPPEVIKDDAPLFRSNDSDVRPIREAALYQLVHDLFRKCGILGQKKGPRYDLRVHSLRKYFRTQLTSLGLPLEYVEYMMGHTISTYNDVQSKGVEFLRAIYARSNLSIRPRTQVGKLDMLKEMIRAAGFDPEQILVKDALVQPHRTVVGPAKVKEGEDPQVLILRHTLFDIMTKEIPTQTSVNRTLE